MKQVLAFLISCFFMCCTFSQTEPLNIVRNQIERVENSLGGNVKIEGTTGYHIVEQMKFYKVKGLSIAVIHDYKIAWAKGYGWADENAKREVTEKTLFNAASVSKSVNSMGIMKLVQDGKLDLSRDINDYLVSWKFPYDDVSKGKKITTLNLLTHTAGVSDGAAGYIDKDSIPSIIQVLNGTNGSKYVYSDAAKAHSVTEPGIRFQYSNVGVGITQVIVTDIAGKSYENYMADNVFKVLGMNSSCYEETTLKKYGSDVAVGYTNGYEIPGRHIIVPMQSAGGLYTTPSDLAKFIIEIQLAYAGKSGNVLLQETVKTMLTPYLEAAPGFFITQLKPGGQSYFHHSGAKRGFACEYYGSLENGNGVVVMINSDGPSGNIIQEVINSVASVYQWKDFYAPEYRRKPVEPTKDLLGKCEGVYTFDDKYVVILNQPDGGHYWTDRRDSRMYFSGDKNFFQLEYPTTKEILFDAGGNVTGIKRFHNAQEISTAVKVKNVQQAGLTAWQISDIAWYLLENKRFALALEYYKRFDEIVPEDLMTRCNTAHCYLFLYDYEKAMKLYKDNMDMRIDNVSTFKETILTDFVFFKRNNFDSSVMKKAMGDLNLPIPGEF